jgi:hypothetical protein
LLIGNLETLLDPAIAAADSLDRRTAAPSELSTQLLLSAGQKCSEEHLNR